MMKKIMRRLRSNRGESLVESMIAIVIAALTAMILAGAVVSAARVNAGAKKIVTFPGSEHVSSLGEKTLTLTMQVSDSETYTENITVNLYAEEQEGMVYYEKNEKK